MHGIFSQGGTENNRVKVGKRNTLLGDPNIKPEKPHTIVGFPGGDVEIARCEDGRYWVHVAVHDISPENRAGTITDARIDAHGRYADEANKVLRDEIAKGDVTHIAFLVTPPALLSERGRD